MTEDTIVAIATPPGRGGVGIVRISGTKAYEIASQIANKKDLEPRQAIFSCFRSIDQQIVDQGLIVYFKAPHSFTGEDVIELHAHGSPFVLDVLVKTCITLGARIARPGEFSERAFLNDKIDLTQAEAIADLIQASSETAARMALNTLQGEFSNKINRLNEEIIHLRLYVEAAIDFPDEEIDFLSDGKVEALLIKVIDQLQIIRSQANQGAIIREGLSIVIAGKPNAGKSTLINLLAGRDVAIVTEIPGTTRDVMREHILLDEIPLHIVDTAGLRKSSDLVEQEGIKRAWNELKKADCVLYLVDLSDTDTDTVLLNEIKDYLDPNTPVITVFNKTDKVPKIQQKSGNEIFLSAKEGTGVEDLKEAIKKVVGYQPTEGHFLARRRHLQALDEAKRLLDIGLVQLQNNKAGELLAEDLRLAHQVLGEITGEFSSDDLLGKIFSSFCIGK